MKPTSEILDTKTTSPSPGLSLIDGKKQCPDCGKFFNTSYLKLHCDAVHLKKQNFCHDCGRAFTFASSLKCHQKKTCKGKTKAKAKEVEGLVQCKECGKEMKECSLASHIKRVHIRGRVKCKQCGKELQKDSLAEHTKLVHIDGRVKCQQCGKEMKNKKSLRKHIIRVHADGPVKCEQCGKEMKNKITLANHLKIFHSNKSTFVKCDLCQKSLKKDSMKDHQAMHRRVFIKALRV